MTKQSLLKSTVAPALVGKFFRLFGKAHGEFTIETPTNGYWVRLHHGMVVDGPPVLKDFFRLSYQVLLIAVKKQEQEYEFFSLTR